MQDNASSFNETQESSSSPKIGGKKAKLNDGSLRVTFTDTVNKNESLDTGTSIDTPESGNNNDPGPSTSEDPLDRVMIVTPSTSGLQVTMVNIKRETWSHNYENRNAPDRTSDGYSSINDTVEPSDDITPSTSWQVNDDSDESDSNENQTEIDDNQRSIESGRSTPDGDDESNGAADDSTDEDVPWSRPCDEQSLPAVLLKTRPKHNYSILKEVLNRELGLSFPLGKTTVDDRMFTQKFHSSLHAVLRMKKLHTLLKHNACVNCINFHPEGHLLVSGSDDTNVIVWDWLRKVPLHTVNAGRKSNVFQSKFINLNSSSQLNIVTSGRDGQVRLSQCSSAGGSWSRRRLAGHGKAVNKLHVMQLEPYSVMSAGEDGFVLHCDLRADTFNKLFQVRERNAAVALYSLDGPPFEPKELLVAGRDKFIRVYDRRKSNKPVAFYCPTVFTEEITIDKKTMRLSAMHPTCAVYNHDGTEILGSYNDDDIYLFDVKTDVYTKGVSSNEKKGYRYRYTGHRNSATLKSVTFYGPKSEYIVSGSDCGYMYIWEKHTESIIQWLKGDTNGIVNSVEPHPRIPILASGGLDKDIKIWAPYSDMDPRYDGLSNTIRNNCSSQWQAPLFNDFLPSLYRSWHNENRLVVHDEDVADHGQIELEANICSIF